MAEDMWKPIKVQADEKVEAEQQGALHAIQVAAFVNTLHHELQTINGSGISFTPEYLAVISNNYAATVFRPSPIFEADE